MIIFSFLVFLVDLQINKDKDKVGAIILVSKITAPTVELT